MRFFASVFCTLFFGTVCVGQQASAHEPKWSPWVEFGGAYVTDDASRGSVTLYAPLSQGPRDLLFIDARVSEHRANLLPVVHEGTVLLAVYDKYLRLGHVVEGLAEQNNHALG